MSRGIRGVGGVAALAGAVMVSPVLVPGGSASTAAEPCTQTRGAINAEVVSGGTASHSFVVPPDAFPSDATLVDLDVGLGFDDYIGDAAVWLGHGGREMLLMGQYTPVPSPQPTYDLVYDDEAAAPLSPESPSGGRYQPPQGSQYAPLAVFDGTPAAGDYVVRITNVGQGVVKVKRLRLEMTLSSCHTIAPPTIAPPTTAPPTPTCATGCAYPRTVGLRHRAARHRLVGKVESVAAGCRSDVPVTIWKKPRGTDRRLVVVTTKRAGKFVTKAPRSPGRYYASVGSADEPLCGSATSRTVRVRRR